MTTIQKLVIRGFKSFPHRTEIPFGTKFNMLIGANGSGKSNISDALCFVLGKSSASELRAKKSSNLIYHGGKKIQPAKDADVSIEFDNSTNAFPLAEKSIKISRVVKKDGQSVYKINDKAVTRQQVIDLLSAARIDPDGHNIILQGDIVKFTEMKPNEKRGIIENISGISVYEDKKDKCLLELEKVDARLNEATIILTERETNLRELKKDRDQALKYKELQKEVVDHKATHIHLQIKSKKEKQEELEKKINENQAIVDKINKEIADRKTDIIKIKEEIKNINNEIEEKGEKEQLILRKEIEELKENIIKTQSRRDVCKTEVDRINSRKNTLKEDFKEIEKNIETLNKKKKETDLLIKKQNEEENLIIKELNKLKEKYNIEDFSGIDKLENDIDEINNQILQLQEKKQSLIREKDKIEFQLKEIENKLEVIKNNKELQALKQRKDDLKKITDSVEKLTAENNSHNIQLSKSRQDIVNINNELYSINVKYNNAIENKSLDNAIKRILNLKLKGVHGTISQLGKVNQKYALALEVTAGPRINSIIVDDDQVASDCIKYLKENKLGIATFLPLNKIKPRTIIYSKKEGIEDLAVNLIEFNQKYKNAFQYLFGSTLIVKDIQSARKLGIGSQRMVTIDGDLLDQSGAMIGGYRERRLQHFMEKDTEKDIQSKETEINKLKSLIVHLEERRSKTENELLSLKETRANTEFEVIKLEKTIGIKIDTTELLENQKSLNSELKNINLKEIESQILNKQKEINKIKENKLKLKEKLKDPSVSREFEDLENKKTKIKEKTIELRGEINNIDAQIKTIYIPENEKINKIIKQQDIDNEKFFNEFNSLIEMIKSRTEELKQKEKKEKDSYTNFKNLAVKRNKLNENIQKIETDIIRNEEKGRAAEQRNNSISIDRAKIVAEIEAANKEFEQYKDGIIKRNINPDELKDKIRGLEKDLASIGNVNLRALEVYENIETEYKQLVEKRDKLLSEKQDVILMMQEIESKKKDIFMKCYKEIDRNFQSIFSQLTTKAEATLSLENPEAPLEGGMDILVKLPGNKILDLKSLSGGEKTMTALAFIFAVQEHQPSSFYLLDEVDAALDKRNSEMLARLIEKYSEKAQYIVISHNDAIITGAENIYGVSMQEGISKVVSLKV